MKKLSTIFEDHNNINITFGEEIQIEDKEAVMLPVIVNGVEMSTDDIKFSITPEYLDNKFYYRPDIFIKKELRGKGLGYNIYKAFIHEFGNVICPDAFRENNVEIPKIYNRLAKEPDIVVERKPGGYYAYLKSQR